MKTRCYICLWHWQQFERRIKSMAKKNRFVDGIQIYQYLHLYIWWVFCGNMHKNLIKTTILHQEFISGRHQDDQKYIFKDAHSSFLQKSENQKDAEDSVRRGKSELCSVRYRWEKLPTENDVSTSWQKLQIRPGNSAAKPRKHLCINRRHRVLGFDLKFYGSILISSHRKWSAPSYLE